MIRLQSQFLLLLFVLLLLRLLLQILFLLFFVILVRLLLVCLVYPLVVVSLISILIIHSFVSNSFSFYFLVHLVCHHQIVSLLDTVQPGVSILASAFKHEISIVVNIAHLLLFFHVEWLNHIAEILNLRFDVFFLALFAIHV